jgi:hypothetical protein
VSTLPSAPAPATAPVFGRAAIAILGTMIVLIVALTVLLVETTWSDRASAAQVSAVEQASFARR